MDFEILQTLGAKIGRHCYALTVIKFGLLTQLCSATHNVAHVEPLTMTISKFQDDGVTSTTRRPYLSPNTMFERRIVSEFAKVVFKRL